MLELMGIQIKQTNKHTAMSCVRVLTVIEGDDVQTVEKLSLVLVDPLDLDIKDGLWVDFDLVFLL